VGGEGMFKMKNFLQTIGISIFMTIIFSVMIGFIEIPSYNWYVALQMLVTYGSLGYFSAMWSPKTPYSVAFLGATVVTIVSMSVAYFMFDILVFLDPEGIGRSMSLTVTLTLIVTAITIFLKHRGKGASA